jgi:hypothetical protein
MYLYHTLCTSINICDIDYQEKTHIDTGFVKTPRALSVESNVHHPPIRARATHHIRRASYLYDTLLILNSNEMKSFMQIPHIFE